MRLFFSAANFNLLIRFHNKVYPYASSDGSAISHVGLHKKKKKKKKQKKSFGCSMINPLYWASLKPTKNSSHIIHSYLRQVLYIHTHLKDFYFYIYILSFYNFLFVFLSLYFSLSLKLYILAEQYLILSLYLFIERECLLHDMQKGTNKVIDEFAGQNWFVV